VSADRLLIRDAAAAKTPGEAMDVADKAVQQGRKPAAQFAFKRAADLCQTQKDALQVAKTAAFLGYQAAADHAYKLVESLPTSEEFETQQER